MKFTHLLLAIAITFVWGVNFLFIKMGVEQIDPFLLAAMRFSLVAFPAVFFIARPKIPFRYLMGYGLVFGIGVWGLATLAMKLGLSPGVSAMLIQMTAFITMFLGVILYKEPFGLGRIVGALFALIGILLISSLKDGSVTFIGLFLGLFAASCFSISTLIAKKTPIKQMLGLVVWSSIFAPIPLLLMAWLNGGFVNFSLNQLSQDVWISAGFQAYPTTLLGYWLWNRLVTQYPLTTMSSINLLVSVFALLSAWFFYDEDMSDSKILAALCVISGACITIWYDKVKRIFLSFYKMVRSKKKVTV